MTSRRTQPAAFQARAAAYVRMSTDVQSFSIQRQCDDIYKYASEHGLTIVRLYADEGKSGLRIQGRKGLRTLLNDVTTGNTDYTTVLVHDVSRWGRFQDVDESAHYEFVCREAGIRVVYCAEQFQDDDSVVSSILKNIKRAMAAEYSRELSAKVFSAQSKLLLQGFRQGARAGYGLRRIVVTPDGHFRGQLMFGDRKGRLTDRVVLTLGPSQEIETVRRIYRMYTIDKLGDREISRRLNSQGILAEDDHSWTAAKVKVVLTNEKYIGNYLYNQYSGKMSTPMRRNAENTWVRFRAAFPAIVSTSIFKRAQQERRIRMKKFTDEELLEKLRTLYLQHGAVSTRLIGDANHLPQQGVFRSRFGGLLNAYKLAGIPIPICSIAIEHRKMILTARNQLRDAAVRIIEGAGHKIEKYRSNRATNMLVLNDTVFLRFLVSKCSHKSTRQPRWEVPTTIADVPPHYTLCARLEDGGLNILDYFLFSPSDFSRGMIMINRDSKITLGLQFSTLEDVFAGRTCQGH